MVNFLKAGNVVIAQCFLLLCINCYVTSVCIDDGCELCKVLISIRAREMVSQTISNMLPFISHNVLPFSKGKEIIYLPST